MTSGPRQRLIDSAITMVRERGVHATGVADLLKRSGTARNSIYQHFPSGKSELIVAATRESAAQSGEFLAKLSSRGDAEYVLTKFIGWWIRQLEERAFDTGCPFAAGALAGPDEADIRDAANDALAGLRASFTGALRGSGITEGVESLSSLVVSAIEGALLQAQAARSVQPLRDVEHELVAVIQSRRR